MAKLKLIVVDNFSYPFSGSNYLKVNTLGVIDANAAEVYGTTYGDKTLVALPYLRNYVAAAIAGSGGSGGEGGQEISYTSPDNSITVDSTLKTLTINSDWISSAVKTFDWNGLLNNASKKVLSTLVSGWGFKTTDTKYTFDSTSLSTDLNTTPNTISVKSSYITDTILGIGTHSKGQVLKINNTNDGLLWGPAGIESVNLSDVSSDAAANSVIVVGNNGKLSASSETYLKSGDLYSSTKKLSINNLSSATKPGYIKVDSSGNTTIVNLTYLTADSSLNASKLTGSTAGFVTINSSNGVTIDTNTYLKATQAEVYNIVKNIISKGTSHNKFTITNKDDTNQIVIADLGDGSGAGTTNYVYTWYSDSASISGNNSETAPTMGVKTDWLSGQIATILSTNVAVPPTLSNGDSKVLKIKKANNVVSYLWGEAGITSVNLSDVDAGTGNSNKLITVGTGTTLTTSTGNGFVKVANGVVSYDNSTYLTTAGLTKTNIYDAVAAIIQKGTSHSGFDITKDSTAKTITITDAGDGSGGGGKTEDNVSTSGTTTTIGVKTDWLNGQILSYLSTLAHSSTNNTLKINDSNVVYWGLDYGGTGGDGNTTYTIVAGNSTGTKAVTNNGNSYITVKGSDGNNTQFVISGTQNVSVATDTNGNVTITGPDLTNYKTEDHDHTYSNGDSSLTFTPGSNETATVVVNTTWLSGHGTTTAQASGGYIAIYNTLTSLLDTKAVATNKYGLSSSTLKLNPLKNSSDAITGFTYGVNPQGLGDVITTDSNLNGVYDTSTQKFKISIKDTLSTAIAGWGFVRTNPTGGIELTDPVYSADKNNLLYIVSNDYNTLSTIMHEGTGVSLAWNKNGANDANGHVTISVDTATLLASVPNYYGDGGNGGTDSYIQRIAEGTKDFKFSIKPAANNVTRFLKSVNGSILWGTDNNTEYGLNIGKQSASDQYPSIRLTTSNNVKDFITISGFNGISAGYGNTNLGLTIDETWFHDRMITANITYQSSLETLRQEILAENGDAFHNKLYLVPPITNIQATSAGNFSMRTAILDNIYQAKMPGYKTYSAKTNGSDPAITAYVTVMDEDYYDGIRKDGYRTVRDIVAKLLTNGAYRGNTDINLISGFANSKLNSTVSDSIYTTMSSTTLNGHAQSLMRYASESTVFKLEVNPEWIDTQIGNYLTNNPPTVSHDDVIFVGGVNYTKNGAVGWNNDGRHYIHHKSDTTTKIRLSGINVQFNTDANGVLTISGTPDEDTNSTYGVVTNGGLSSQTGSHTDGGADFAINTTWLSSHSQGTVDKNRWKNGVSGGYKVLTEGWLSSLIHTERYQSSLKLEPYELLAVTPTSNDGYWLKVRPLWLYKLQNSGTGDSSMPEGTSAILFNLLQPAFDYTSSIVLKTRRRTRTPTTISGISILVNPFVSGRVGTYEVGLTIPLNYEIGDFLTGAQITTRSNLQLTVSNIPVGKGIIARFDFTSGGIGSKLRFGAANNDNYTILEATEAGTYYIGFVRYDSISNILCIGVRKVLGTDALTT